MRKYEDIYKFFDFMILYCNGLQHFCGSVPIFRLSEVPDGRTPEENLSPFFPDFQGVLFCKMQLSGYYEAVRRFSKFPLHKLRRLPRAY